MRTGTVFAGVLVILCVVFGIMASEIARDLSAAWGAS